MGCKYFGESSFFINMSVIRPNVKIFTTFKDIRNTSLIKLFIHRCICFNLKKDEEKCFVIQKITNGH